MLEAFKREFPAMDALATQAQNALHSADSIDLVFLVPDENYSSPQKDPDKEYFNWWKVTGRTVLADTDRQTVIQRLEADIESNRRKPYADCFEPRHALRAKDKNGGHLDIVICFKCIQLWCFDQNGNRIESQTVISKDLQPFLDSLRLTDKSADGQSAK